MEIKVESLNNSLPPKCYVGIRSGGVQKQALYDPHTKYRFSDVKRFSRVDIFARVGTCDIAWSCDDNETRTCCALDANKKETDMKMKVSMTRLALCPKTLSASAPGPAKTNSLSGNAQANNVKGDSAAKSAKYISDHRVEDILTNAMRALLKDLPDDAPAFLCDFISKNYGSGKSKPDNRAKADRKPSNASITSPAGARVASKTAATARRVSSKGPLELSNATGGAQATRDRNSSGASGASSSATAKAVPEPTPTALAQSAPSLQPQDAKPAEPSQAAVLFSQMPNFMRCLVANASLSGQLAVQLSAQPGASEDEVRFMDWLSSIRPQKPQLSVQEMRSKARKDILAAATNGKLAESLSKVPKKPAAPRALAEFPKAIGASSVADVAAVLGNLSEGQLARLQGAMGDKLAATLAEFSKVVQASSETDIAATLENISDAHQKKLREALDGKTADKTVSSGAKATCDAAPFDDDMLTNLPAFSGGSSTKNSTAMRSAQVGDHAEEADQKDAHMRSAIPAAFAQVPGSSAPEDALNRTTASWHSSSSKHSQKSLQRSATSWIEANIRCPKDHQMSRPRPPWDSVHEETDVFDCDVCKKACPPPEEVFFCKACDYVLCRTCADKDDRLEHLRREQKKESNEPSDIAESW